MVINLQEKKEIRKDILGKRKNLSDTFKREFSQTIVEQFVRSREFQETEVLLCYVSTKEEVRTEELMQIAWSDGKKVGVPKVIGKHEMEFYEIHNFQELQKGYRGILEPKEGNRLCNDSALVVVPGVAFDLLGRRIGYGGGFYDTYLRKHPEYLKAAFAFDDQIIEKVPAESHDISMDFIYTEKGVYRRW